MIPRATAFTLVFQLWDVANNTGKTGDAGNLTLRVITDGTAAAPANSPSEIDATNLPGLCKITLTASEIDGKFIAFGGKSSTANVLVVPVMMLTDTASKGVAQSLVYMAIDTATGLGKTGDAANHTLKFITDGTDAAATNSPSEIDATNLPGLYTIAATASEMDGTAVTLGGKSSTAGVKIIPVHMVTDPGRYYVETSANDSIRQRIMDALETRLATILTTNGYKTNLGNNVFRWRNTDVEPLISSELPGVNFRDMAAEQEDDTVDRVYHRMLIELDLFAKGENGDETIRLMYADIQDMIRSDPEWSGLANRTLLPDDDLEVDRMQDNAFRGDMSFLIEYSTDRFNAYS